MKTNRFLPLAALAVLLVACAERALAVRDPFENKKQAPKVNVHPGPENLVAHQQHLGKTFYFEVTGSTVGTVWGTGIYTNDSRLATVAVHAGILRNGQKGVVKVTILPGQGGYQGSFSNGVTSNNYGAWNGSYRVEAVNLK